MWNSGAQVWMCMNIINLINGGSAEYSWRHSRTAGFRQDVLLFLILLFFYITRVPVQFTSRRLGFSIAAWQCIYIQSFVFIKKIKLEVTFLKNKQAVGFAFWRALVLFLDGRTRPRRARLTNTCLPVHIKHATFIFITGRWQLLTQDAELIRKPVLYAAAGNKEGGKKRRGEKNKRKWNVKIGSITSMRMDKCWRDTDEGANWVADDSLAEQKESIQAVLSAFLTSRLSPSAGSTFHSYNVVRERRVCWTRRANNLRMEQNI